MVLSGLIPNHLKVQYEAAYDTVYRLSISVLIHDTIYHTVYDRKIKVMNNHQTEITELCIDYNAKDISIYRDDPQLELGDTGAVFVVYKNK